MGDVELPDPKELEEERGKTFTRRVALTTAFFAVALAVTSLGGNNAMKGMILAQQQASDQWAFYQAKAVREHLYDTQKILLQAGLDAGGRPADAATRARREAVVARMEAEAARFRSEKTAIEKRARELESERDRCESKDPYFDYAEVLLQIAIVLSSIAILSGARPVFGVAVAAAVGGVVLSANGFLLLFRIPFFH